MPAAESSPRAPGGVTFAELDMRSGERFQLLRRELGVASLGINLLRLEAGERGRIHAHERQEEVYLVLEGELTLVVEGEELVVPRNGLVHVPPSTRRQLTNRGPAALRLLAVGAGGDHAGRDGLAWASWDEPADAGRPPQEVPLPADI